MISVARHRLDERGVPIRPSDDWFELARAAELRALGELEAHLIDDAVYRHAKVRMALEKLFHDKCAYCEGSSLGQADWDVEHFRPKGRVAERGDHPGYYWLAYRWENLYPSCSHCNQKRKDRPRWGDRSGSASEALGKLDQFPLAREVARAMGPDEDLGAEEPLLLDPCRDLPEDHLRFDIHGAPLAVGGSERGEASIEVFHLGRKRLRDQRRRRILEVVALIRVLNSLEGKLGQADPVVVETREVLERYFLADSASFAGVGRWVRRDPVSFGI